VADQDPAARVIVRPPAREDEAEFIGLVQASAALHHPWISLAGTPAGFRAYLERYQQPAEDSLLICLRSTGAIAGLVNISSITRGRFQNASIAYAAFAPAAGQGYMTEGGALALRYAFTQLRLHRVEAAIQPGNQASIRLVQRLGFRREGYSPDMLFIDGAWRDHERWALTAPMACIEAAPHPSLPPR
jgi:ribosomal-protein-alanine N-acetyltransferase